MGTLNVGRLAIAAGLLVCGVVGAGASGAARGQGKMSVPAATNVFVLPRAVSAAWHRSSGSSVTGRIRFRVPKADGGSVPWYRIQGRLRVELVNTGREASRAETDIGVNGRAGVEVNWISGRLGRLEGAWWGSDNLLDGFVFGSIWTKVTVLPFGDYLPFRTVHPGWNELYLRVFNFRGALLGHATLLPGTSVVYSRLAPAQLRISVRVQSPSVRLGETFGVHYVLADEGMPASNVGMMISISNEGVVLMGSPTVFVGDVIRRRSGDIRFLALVPGTYRIAVSAQGSSGTGPLGGIDGTALVRVVKS
jgi:hypothetical protein